MWHFCLSFSLSFFFKNVPPVCLSGGLPACLFDAPQGNSELRFVSVTLPLALPGARRHQAPQHYALLPPSVSTPAFLRHAHQCIIGLTWTQSLVNYLPYISQFPTAALMLVCRCYPCVDAVPVLLPVCSALNSLYLLPISSVGPFSFFLEGGFSPAL